MKCMCTLIGSTSHHSIFLSVLCDGEQLRVAVLQVGDLCAAHALLAIVDEVLGQQLSVRNAMSWSITWRRAASGKQRTLILRSHGEYKKNWN